MTMAVKSTMVLLVVVMMISICSVESAKAPSPGIDCMTLSMNMADCLSYVSSDSTEAKPKPTCCSGLKTVLKTDAACLCEAFKNSASFGVTLNITKSLALPAACKINAPSASNCGLSLPPAAAPAMSGTIVPLPGAPSVPEGAAVEAPAPAPAPGNSASSFITISAGSLISGLLVVLFYSF